MFNEQDAWPMPLTEASSRRSYDPSEVFAVNNTSLMLEEPALTVRMLVLSVPTSIMIPELSLSIKATLVFIRTLPVTWQICPWLQATTDVLARRTDPSEIHQIFSCKEAKRSCYFSIRTSLNGLLSAFTLIKRPVFVSRSTYLLVLGLKV